MGGIDRSLIAAAPISDAGAQVPGGDAPIPGNDDDDDHHRHHHHGDGDGVFGGDGDGDNYNDDVSDDDGDVDGNATDRYRQIPYCKSNGMGL